MNTIEDRLRDAYHDAAMTVIPGEIRQLGEPSVTIARPAPRTRRTAAAPHRAVLPLTAAVAVAAVSVLSAVVVPRLLASARHDPVPPATSAAGPAGRFLVAISSSNAATLTVHGAVSGTTAGRIAVPRRGENFNALATGDGRHYVAAVTRPDSCHTSLYEFTLTNAGHPSALVPYRLSGVGQIISALAVSKDNSTIAYFGHSCATPAARRMPASDLTVVKVATLQARRWSLPRPTVASSLTLTDGGSLLGYVAQAGLPGKTSAYVLPASAAPGQAIQRSRLVASAPRIRGAAQIPFAALTPDGSTMYYAVNFARHSVENRWQLRAVSLAASHTRIVRRYAGVAQYLTPGPFVRQALVVTLPEGVTWTPVTPPPAPTPAPSATGRGTAEPAPSLSSRGTGAAGAAPPPAPPGGSARPTPAPRSSSASPTPVPSATPEPLGFELIKLPTGAVRRISARWGPVNKVFIW